MRGLWILLLLVSVVGMSVVGCGKAKVTTTISVDTRRADPPAKPAAPAGLSADPKSTTPLANAITIKDFSYQPSVLVVEAGATVTWTNQDSVAHTVIGADFDSGLIQQGQSWSHVFPTRGSYNYHCRPHPYMKGQINVR